MPKTPVQKHSPIPNPHTGARRKILSNNDNFQNFRVVTSDTVVYRGDMGTWNGMEYLTSVVSANNLVLILSRLNENIVLVNKKGL